MFVNLAPVSCPGTGASLTMVNGKMYHGSDLEYEHKDVRNYCMDLDMELASVATQENYDNVQFFVGEHENFITVLVINEHHNREPSYTLTLKCMGEPYSPWLFPKDLHSNFFFRQSLSANFLRELAQP